MYDYDLDDVYKDTEEEKEEGYDEHTTLKEELERLDKMTDPIDNSIIENGTFQNDTNDNLIHQYRISGDELVEDRSEKVASDDENENVLKLDNENGEAISWKLAMSFFKTKLIDVTLICHQDKSFFI